MNTTNILNGVTLASRDEITEHSENTAVHLTEEERTTWNAKADASALSGKVDTGTFTAHETNTTVHITNEEREKWNARTTKGVVAATQDGLDEHTENTTVHITEEERTAWNEAAAIPGASNAFTGDNTHEGVEAFNGPTIHNAPVQFDDVTLTSCDWSSDVTESIVGRYGGKDERVMSALDVALYTVLNAPDYNGVATHFGPVEGGGPVAGIKENGDISIYGIDRNKWYWATHNSIYRGKNLPTEQPTGDCIYQIKFPFFRNFDIWIKDVQRKQAAWQPGILAYPIGGDKTIVIQLAKHQNKFTRLRPNASGPSCQWMVGLASGQVSNSVGMHPRCSEGQSPHSWATGTDDFVYLGAAYGINGGSGWHINMIVGDFWATLTDMLPEEVEYIVQTPYYPTGYNGVNGGEPVEHRSTVVAAFIGNGKSEVMVLDRSYWSTGAAAFMRGLLNEETILGLRNISTFSTKTGAITTTNAKLREINAGNVVDEYQTSGVTWEKLYPSTLAKALIREGGGPTGGSWGNGDNARPRPLLDPRNRAMVADHPVNIKHGRYYSIVRSKKILIEQNGEWIEPEKTVGYICDSLLPNGNAVRVRPTVGINYYDPVTRKETQIVALGDILPAKVGENAWVYVDLEVNQAELISWNMQDSCFCLPEFSASEDPVTIRASTNYKKWEYLIYVIDIDPATVGREDILNDHVISRNVGVFSLLQPQNQE